MATSIFPAQGGAVGITETRDAGANKVFVPELWSDEIIAAYKKNLVLANFIRKMSMKGKKGDAMHIPKPARGFVATTKAENTAVTLQNLSVEEVIVYLDKHKEVSYLIEDIVDVQALSSLRRHYTDEAGYAIAQDVDNALFELGKSLGDGTGADYVHSNTFSFAADGTLTPFDGIAATNAFDDIGFRRAIQYLDDANVPMDGRVFIIPPSLRNALNGEPRYTEQAFVGEVGGQNTIRNGEVGNLYGIPVVVTTNTPLTGVGTERGAFLMHKDAFVLAEQMGVRSQTQYKQEFLANLFTTDMLYGTEVLRPENGIVLSVTA